MSEEIVLWVMPRFWKLPNASPFCVKLETWLRLADIPHQTRELAGPPRSQTGKVPYVDLSDGTQLVDSGRIIEELTARRQVTLDEGLTDADRARAVAISRLVEDSLYFTTVYARWQDPAGFAITGPSYFQALPGLLRGLVAAWVRRGVVRSLHGQGLGRDTLEWALHRGLTDLKALSDLLGDQPFFLGDAPRTVDATVFGLVTNIRHAPYPGPLRDAVLADARLCAWEERVRERAWPDWNELPD